MSSKQKKSNIFKRNSMRFFGSVFSEGSDSSKNNSNNQSNNQSGITTNSPKKRLSMLSGNDTRSIKSINSVNTGQSNRTSHTKTVIPSAPKSSSTNAATNSSVISVNKKIFNSATTINSDDNYNYKRIAPESEISQTPADTTLRNVNYSSSVYKSQGIGDKRIPSQKIEISGTSYTKDFLKVDDTNIEHTNNNIDTGHRRTKSEIEKLQDEVEDMILKSPYLGPGENEEYVVADQQDLPLDSIVYSNNNHLTPIGTDKPILPLNVSSENLAALQKLDEYAENDDKDSLLFNERNVNDSESEEVKEVDTYENLIKQQEKLRAANKSHSEYHTPTETMDDLHNANDNSSSPHFPDENDSFNENGKAKMGANSYAKSYTDPEYQISQSMVIGNDDPSRTPERNFDDSSIQDSPALQDSSYSRTTATNQQVLPMTEAPLNSFREEDDFVIQPSIHHIPTMKQEFDTNHNDFYEDDGSDDHVRETTNMIQNISNSGAVPYDHLSLKQNDVADETYGLQGFKVVDNDSASQFKHSISHGNNNSGYVDNDIEDDSDIEPSQNYGSGLQIANPDEDENEEIDNYVSHTGLHVINNESSESDDNEDDYIYASRETNSSGLQVVNNDYSEDEQINNSALRIANGYSSDDNNDINTFIPPSDNAININNNEFGDGSYRRESIDLNSEVNNNNDDYYLQVESNAVQQQKQPSSRYSMAGTPHSNYLSPSQQQGSSSHPYYNSSNNSEVSSANGRPISTTNPFYGSYTSNEKLAVNGSCNSSNADSQSNIYNNNNTYNSCTNSSTNINNNADAQSNIYNSNNSYNSNTTISNNADSSADLSNRNSNYVNSSNNSIMTKSVSSTENNTRANTMKSRTFAPESSNFDRETTSAAITVSSKTSAEEREKEKEKEKEMGKGVKSKYVETLRASTMLSNSQIGSRKWNLPLGIRTIDKRILERKSSQFSNPNQLKSLQKDIKHAALQLSMLAEEEEEEEEEEDDDAVKAGVFKPDNNRRKSKFSGGVGDRDVEESGSSDEDEVDLFADFAEDIEKVNKKVQSPDPAADMDSIIGSPDASNLQRFQSVSTINYGVSQPLFIANPDSD